MIKLESVEQFNELKNGQTVFMFSANWCPDCHFIKPHMPEIEEMYPELTFVEVDRDKFIDLSFENNIYGIPSFLVFKDGQLVGSFVSRFRKTKQEVVQFLNSIK
ncbi:MAG: thioredoxin family protein [Bacilli bacterium]|nr:thioredoxin family protein [Bacilli bacterium]